MRCKNIIPSVAIYTPETVVCERTRETLTNYKLHCLCGEKRIHCEDPGGGADAWAAGNPVFTSQRGLRRIVYGLLWHRIDSPRGVGGIYVILYCDAFYSENARSIYFRKLLQSTIRKDTTGYFLLSVYNFSFNLKLSIICPTYTQYIVDTH